MGIYKCYCDEYGRYSDGLVPTAYCYDYYYNNSMTGLISIMTSIVVVIFNIIIKQVNLILVNMINFHYKSE